MAESRDLESTPTGASGLEYGLGSGRNYCYVLENDVISQFHLLEHCEKNVNFPPSRILWSHFCPFPTLASIFREGKLTSSVRMNQKM